VRVIDHGHEEIGGGDHAGPSGSCHTAASSEVSVRPEAGEQRAGLILEVLAGQELLQHGGGQLAAATAAVGKLGQAQLRGEGSGLWSMCVSLGLVRD